MLSSAGAALVGSSKDLVYEILSRLPWTSFIRFRLVCKEWRSLINIQHTPCLVVQYLNYGSLTYNYLKNETTTKSDHFKTLFLKLDDYNNNNDDISMNWVREHINLTSNFGLKGRGGGGGGKIYYQQQSTNFFTYYDVKLISSCRGFLLFTAKPAPASNMLARFHRWMTKEEDPALILYNPVTKEKHIVTAPLSTHVYCGFYYHSPTKEHRILYQLNFDPHQAGFVKFLVFGLQTKSTRVLNLKVNNNITPPPADTSAYYYNRIDTSTPPVISNGSLHWVLSEKDIKCCSQYILSFGIESEEFRTMPHPPMQSCGTPHRMNLLEMEGGILCLGAGNGPTWNKLGIYVMEDYKNWTWIRRYCINLDYYMHMDTTIYGRGYKALQILQGNRLLLHFYNKTNNKIYQEEYALYSLNEHEDGRSLDTRPKTRTRMVRKKSNVNQKKRQPFQVIIHGFNVRWSIEMNGRLMKKLIIKSGKKWRAPFVRGNMVVLTPSLASLIHHNGTGTGTAPPRISTFFSIRTNRSYEYV